MAKKKNESLIVDTAHLEGALFIPDILEKIIRGDHTHQTTEDYKIPKGIKLHEEYGRSFQIAQAQWKTFEPQTEREDVDKWKVTEHFVSELLRDALGYSDIKSVSDSLEIGDRRYPVTAMTFGRIPVVIAPYNIDLDDTDPIFSVEGMGARRLSASRLAQMFLDASSECTWALVSNGKKLRLLRDTATLTRPTYLECDLDTVLSEKRYPDFSALWRIFHASRAGEPDTPGTLCIWETWREEGKEQGTRVREGLRDGVTKALLSLGQGFIQHPSNTELRSLLFDGTLTKNDFFQELLRLIYRFLFMFTVEERGILHGEGDSIDTRIFRERYWEGYALKRLRDRSLRKSGFDQYEDLWQSVQIVFRGLADGEPRLALPALGGLFAPSQCPNLDNCALTNKALLSAMRQLRWSGSINGLSPVDFKNMGPEELGSVYESLLELVPHVDLTARHFGFVGLTEEGLTSGHDRKTTGSYYTPDILVQELIRSALDPVIDERIKAKPDHPEEAILNITVIDPACGSGHFLLAAARRLAERLADLRSPDGTVKPDDYRHALREVIARCIYGVDKNPLALELARTVLWLEGFEPGRALSFLDHHLVCGDALLGISHFDQMKNGIPDDAFKSLSGDNKDICNYCRQENQVFRNILTRRRRESITLSPELSDAFDLLASIDAMNDDTPDQVHKKENAYLDFLTRAQNSRLAKAADLFIGAFLIPKSNGSNPKEIPTTKHLTAELFGEKEQEDQQRCVDLARQYCHKARVLHWPLTFPRIFAQGGFDCVLGNPPWERIKLQEQEFFATRCPEVATAKNKAEREKRISWLSAGQLARNLNQGNFDDENACDAEVTIYLEFVRAKRTSEAVSLFVHIKGDEGGRFPLTGKGDVNTYALFAETNRTILFDNGCAGIIVPTGISTDDTTKLFFQDLIIQRHLISLVSFYEVRKWFKATDERKPFCLLSIGKCNTPKFIFDVKEITDLLKNEKWFVLTDNDFRAINPNTLTCPIFRSRMDADITKKIYLKTPVLIREATNEMSEKNPWRISFLRMLDMANDSHLFKSYNSNGDLPLYEAKMIHQFDHRWAGYCNIVRGKPSIADSPDTEKQNFNFSIEPQYWVDKRHVLSKIARVPKPLSRAYAVGDDAAVLKNMANWIDSERNTNALETSEQAKKAVIEIGGKLFEKLPNVISEWQDTRLQENFKMFPKLTEKDLNCFRAGNGVSDAINKFMDKRSPKWLIGFRDITNSSAERTVITSVIPRAGANHKLPLIMHNETCNIKLSALLLANLNSLVLDYVARQKVSGTSLTYFYLKQFPIIPNDRYTDSDVAYIIPRILELTYTTYDLQPWADDLGYSGEPFTFDREKRSQIKSELDSYYAHLYGLTRNELRYILDPSEIMGEEYPSETFRVLKNNEMKEYGEYRTGRLVLESYDKLMEDVKVHVPSLEETEVVSYPGTDFDRQSCALTLALVESQEAVTFEKWKDVLRLIKESSCSMHFLSETDFVAFNNLRKKISTFTDAPHLSVDWERCIGYLENNRSAVHLDRFAPDRPLSKGAKFRNAKGTFPQVSNQLISFALKALNVMHELKRNPGKASDEQEKGLRQFDAIRRAS